MEIISTAKPYASVLGELPVVLTDVMADNGLDIEIRHHRTNELLGVKRIYTSPRAIVNIAPYLRSQIVVKPFTGDETGLMNAHERTAGCTVTAGGNSIVMKNFVAGAHDAHPGTILSAAPEPRKIRSGERDEISLMTPNDGMLTYIVDADSAQEQDLCSYIVDRTSTGGVRLAWVNRYGAVDYYTFGKQSTVSGSTGTHLTLASEPMDEAGAEWLAEIFSSPAVWIVSGSELEKVKVANGSVETSPSRPSIVIVVIAPFKK